MNFSKGPGEDITDLAENLGTTRTSAWPSLIGFGIVAPIVAAFFAARAWITENAIWFSLSHRESSFDLTGDAAKVMAAVYACAALFIHFRWFWGGMGFEKTSNAGMASALYLGVGAMLTALAFAIAGA